MSARLTVKQTSRARARLPFLDPLRTSRSIRSQVAEHQSLAFTLRISTQLTVLARRTTIQRNPGNQRMSDYVPPETRYAQSGDVNIAYQVMGAGPVDIIMVPGLVSHIEFQHESPGYTAF